MPEIPWFQFLTERVAPAAQGVWSTSPIHTTC
jgi:hypothetical protein